MYFLNCDHVGNCLQFFMKIKKHLLTNINDNNIITAFINYLISSLMCYIITAIVQNIVFEF